MKKLITIVFILISLTSWSHSDKDYIYQYENVTVRFRTGFLFEEIENAKIIGQYAALLCKNQNYTKPILLDFIHDYGHYYEGKQLSFLSIDSGNYDWISYYTLKRDTVFNQIVHEGVRLSDTINYQGKLLKEITLIEPINSVDKIIVRHFGFHFEVEHTLKLIKYAIENPDDIKETSVTTNLESYLSNSYYRLKSIPENKINSIAKRASKEIDKVLKNKIYREKDSISRYKVYHSYFFKNNKYHIFEGHDNKETIIDSVQQVYSIQSVNEIGSNDLFVFINPNLFMFYIKDFLEDTYQASNYQKIPIDEFEYINFIDLNLFKDDIYEIDYYNFIGMPPFKRFLYLREDDVLIKDFESYIDSHRRIKK